MRHTKLLILAVSCIALGVGIGAIASAGASTPSQSHPAAKAGLRRGGRGIRILRRTVAGQLIVKTKSGYAPVTFERGSVTAVNGQQLTLNEGTKKSVYKTVTLTIPAGATVRDNGRAATLSQLTSGQRAIVVTLPARTLVIAHTPKTP
ncbi:MAG TPA: hypothetical protein VG223_06725 [Solirubrobacteraceae bacterium]|nr:hypothetical protein [Solirubrobacteraceae bacterium]